MLGCKLRPDGAPSRQLRRRVELGVALYRDGAAPLLLMSGGGGGPVAEAQVMAELAYAAGVPQSAVLCEPCSRNTAENAMRSARLLRRRGLRRIVLVSGRQHLLRAGLLFRLAGLDPVRSAGVPARSAARAFAAAAGNLVALPRSLVQVLRRR